MVRRMGLVGVLFSSSVGGLSIVLSIIAIRRRRRRRQIEQEASTDLCRASVNETTNAACGWGSKLIKAGTGDFSSTRRAVTVRSHLVGPGTGTSRECSFQALYGSYDSKRRGPHPLTMMIVAGNVSKQDSGVHESRNIMSRSTARLKDSATKASHVTHRCDPWEDNSESSLPSEIAAQVDDWTSSQSGSETESCSFADGGFLSEEEGLRKAEDEYIAETQFQMSGFAQPSEKHGKRVCFQVEGYQPRAFSRRPLDYDKPVSVDVDITNAQEEGNDTASVPVKDDTIVELGAEAGAPSSASHDADSQNQGPVPIIYDAVTQTQEAIDYFTCRENTLLRLRSEDRNESKEERLCFESVETVAPMPALDDVLTAAPTSMTPIAVCEQDDATSRVSDFVPSIETRSQVCNKRDTPKAISLLMEDSEDSHRFSDEEKENEASRPSAAPEKLSRQPRQVQRSGTFRRNSQPTLKRFRFSDRIKVGPLRTSGRNSK